MRGNFYVGSDAEMNPTTQVQKIHAAPIVRKLREFETTQEFKDLAENIVVLKIELSSYHTTAKNETSNGDSPNIGEGENKVWRLVACFGDVTLNSLHDQIIAPAMG